MFTVCIGIQRIAILEFILLVFRSNLLNILQKKVRGLLLRLLMNQVNN
jgi:hypothetical protein